VILGIVTRPLISASVCYTVSKVPRAVGRLRRPPVGRPARPPHRPRAPRRSPSTLRRAGVSGGVRIAAHCDAPPGPAMCTKFRPSRTCHDADAGMSASAPASSSCSLGIPASKRRKSSAQRPALWSRARTSADRKQRLSFSSTPSRQHAHSSQCRRW